MNAVKSQRKYDGNPGDRNGSFRLGGWGQSPLLWKSPGHRRYKEAVDRSSMQNLRLFVRSEFSSADERASTQSPSGQPSSPLALLLLWLNKDGPFLRAAYGKHCFTSRTGQKLRSDPSPDDCGVCVPSSTGSGWQRLAAGLLQGVER